MSTAPTLGNGKICYIEIPAIDIQSSVAFYKAVFGWSVRVRNDGSIAFDDGVGQVSGTWVTGRDTTSVVGLLVYIMVDDIQGAINAVISNGGKIAEAVRKDSPEIFARFSDPAGNVFGLYQQRQ